MDAAIDPRAAAMEQALAIVGELADAQGAAHRATKHMPFGYERFLAHAEHMLAWAEQQQTPTQCRLLASRRHTVAQLKKHMAAEPQMRRAA